MASSRTCCCVWRWTKRISSEKLGEAGRVAVSVVANGMAAPSAYVGWSWVGAIANGVPGTGNRLSSPRREDGSQAREVLVFQPARDESRRKSSFDNKFLPPTQAYECLRLPGIEARVEKGWPRGGGQIANS